MEGHTVGGVVSGILIVSAVIAVGYFAARLRILGPDVQGALTRTAFYITNPALLFTVVAASDIRAALGTDAPLALLSAAIVGLLYCGQFPVLSAAGGRNRRRGHGQQLRQRQ